MNFYGNIPVIDRDATCSEKLWNIKRWYILFSKPTTKKEFYISCSMANLYLNTNYEEMTYQVPNINGLLEHIEVNLV
jgi:hypothetical protein